MPTTKSFKQSRSRRSPYLTDEEIRQQRAITWAKFVAEDKAMRVAWLREHPGEAPLPQHLCELDYPFRGFKRWAAKASRWLDAYAKRRV
jgi:hypothetical protein